ncbi:hypothetical protein ALC62_05889 [Cyphomyrmex costatus]|uniref:Uncharacterized protein n=1 Tax=Cyphomyrmex costatus TaxID=456900 RepID=A0A195CR92_9HYME|nr:hypothetical protein ALC62_05889 [Cyphomyrmex costatus]
MVSKVFSARGKRYYDYGEITMESKFIDMEVMDISQNLDYNRKQIDKTQLRNR